MAKSESTAKKQSNRASKARASSPPPARDESGRFARVAKKSRPRSHDADPDDVSAAARLLREQRFSRSRPAPKPKKKATKSRKTAAVKSTCRGRGGSR